MKLIFNEPICTRCECANNDLNYNNNCSITTLVERCPLAQVKHPHPPGRILAWIDNHWLGVAISGLALTFLIIWSLLFLSALNDAGIDELRREQEQSIATRQQHIKFDRLYKKHGLQTVIFVPGQTPYYINQRGQRCRFV